MQPHGDPAEAASIDRPRPIPGNLAIASKLTDYADLIDHQGADGFRSRAFRRAAGVVVALDRPAVDILAERGRDGLVALPGIGQGIAGAIAEMVATGRWSRLERLRGELMPEKLFQTLPGVGPELARRLAEDGELETLEDLEAALHVGKLGAKGFGPRRRKMLSAALAERLGRPSLRPAAQPAVVPPVAMILKVDRLYRDMAAKGELRRIAPRRFNPGGEAWLPILHADVMTIGTSRRSTPIRGWRMSWGRRTTGW